MAEGEARAQAAPAYPDPSEFPAPDFVPGEEARSPELSLALEFATDAGIKELSEDERADLNDRAMGARLRNSDYDLFLQRAPDDAEGPRDDDRREWLVLDNTLGEFREEAFHTREAALAWINMPKFADTGRVVAMADSELFAARGGMDAVNARRAAAFPPMPERIECPFPLFKDRAHKKAAYKLAKSKASGQFWRLEMPARLEVKLPAGTFYLMEDPKLSEPAGDAARDKVSEMIEKSLSRLWDAAISRLPAADRERMEELKRLKGQPAPPDGEGAPEMSPEEIEAEEEGLREAAWEKMTAAEKKQLGKLRKMGDELSGAPTVRQMRAMLKRYGVGQRARQRIDGLMGYEPKTPAELTVRVTDATPPLPVSFFTMSVPRNAMANPKEQYGYTKLILKGRRAGGPAKYRLRDPRPNAVGEHFTYEVRADALASALAEYRESRARHAAEKAAEGKRAWRKREDIPPKAGTRDARGTVPMDLGRGGKAAGTPAAKKGGKAAPLTAQVEAKALEKAGIKTSRQVERERAGRAKWNKEHHVAAPATVTMMDPSAIAALPRFQVRTSLLPDKANAKEAVERIEALRRAGRLRIGDGDMDRLRKQPTVSRVKQVANRRGVPRDVRIEIMDACDHMAAPASERTREAVVSAWRAGDLQVTENSVRPFFEDSGAEPNNLEAWSLVSPRPSTAAYRAVKAAIEEAPVPPAPARPEAGSPRRDRADREGRDPKRPTAYRAKQAPQGLDSLGKPWGAGPQSNK